MFYLASNFNGLKSNLPGFSVVSKNLLSPSLTCLLLTVLQGQGDKKFAHEFCVKKLMFHYSPNSLSMPNGMIFERVSHALFLFLPLHFMSVFLFSYVLLTSLHEKRVTTLLKKVSLSRKITLCSKPPLGYYGWKQERAAKKIIRVNDTPEQCWSSVKWIGEISFTGLPPSYCGVSERKKVSAHPGLETQMPESGVIGIKSWSWLFFTLD